jgi:two-component system nitrogen regulation response regulator NtrX
MAGILIVDDEADIRELISDILKDEGYDTVCASSAAKAIDAVTSGSFSAVVLDIWLEGSEMDGMGVLKAIKNVDADLPVIMISGHGNIETAVQTIQLGAYDFIEKPFKAEKLTILVERAVNTYNLLCENSVLRNQSSQALIEMEGSSRSMQVVIKAAQNAASSNSRVIITGEDGTGKEFLAKYIHKHSPRSGKNFAILNAASLTGENFESELFGKEHKIGILQKCKGGTVYIDEILDLSTKVQSKFLNVLQDTKFNVRIISGSSGDLAKAIEEGKLNSSLYYRLNVVPIHIAPLRERKEDIEILATKFLQYFSSVMGVAGISFSESAIAALQLYNWPGNVRQLKNVTEWLMIMKVKDKQAIEADDLPSELRHFGEQLDNGNWVTSAFLKPLKDARDSFEREYLSAQLNRYGGNISKTAIHVGMDRTALHRKLKSLKT